MDAEVADQWLAVEERPEGVGIDVKLLAQIGDGAALIGYRLESLLPATLPPVDLDSTG
jgi:hypothetical protein